MSPQVAGAQRGWRVAQQREKAGIDKTGVAEKRSEAGRQRAIEEMERAVEKVRSAVGAKELPATGARNKLPYNRTLGADPKVPATAAADEAVRKAKRDVELAEKAAAEAVERAEQVRLQALEALKRAEEQKARGLEKEDPKPKTMTLKRKLGE